MMKNMKKTLLGISLALMASGCATIVGDKTQTVSINSTPDQAAVSIVDERGNQVHNGKTPLSVTLEKSDGSYFGGKSYNVHIEKAGYKPVTFALKARPNGWYIGGNLIFGGLIGWLIVDPFSGKMYSLKPNDLNATLESQASASAFEDGKMTIVLLENVPAKYLGKLQRIN